MRKYGYLNWLKRLVAFLTIFAVFSNGAFASIWNVDINSDTDPNTCVANEADNDDDCTFRDAISQLANGDTIRFLEDETITDTTAGITSHQITANNITIDATTGNRTVNFDGNQKGGGSAAAFLRIYGTNFTLNGVHLYNYNGNAIQLENGANTANIHDNVIGRNSAAAGTGNSYAVNIAGATGVTIQNNVLSNNGRGILINTLQPVDATIKGNRIGVDGTLSSGALAATGGNTAVANSGAGIEVQGGDFSGGLQIGGSAAADRNIISSNAGSAVWVRSSNAVTGTITVQNNYMGLGLDGSTVLANDTSSTSYGVINVDNGAATAANWTIKDNVISGNTGGIGPIPGIAVRSGGSATIQGNKIGVKADGTTAAGNSGPGILVDAGTVIIGTNSDGTNDAAEANIIANNGADGIENTGAETNTITIAGNSIGLDSAGGADGNTLSGIKINSNATTVAIGKVAPSTPANGRNKIGNNSVNGVEIASTGGTSGSPATVTIVNNYIGTDGTTNYPNTVSGIKFAATSGVTNPTIGSNGDGTNDANEANTIGKNATAGVSATTAEIFIQKAVKNLVIAGNIILGNTPTNGSHGILVNNSTDAVLASIVIGGDDCSTDAHATSNSSVERNYITGIKGEAIYIADAGSASPTATSLTVQCNQVGIKTDGTSSANAIKGVNVVDAGNIVFKDNTIANSATDGVNITGATKVEAYGNKIGTVASGLTPAGNGGYGMIINAATLAVSESIPIPVIIGGITAALGNVFAASSGVAALQINDVAATTTPVTIQGNYVGVCADPFGKGTIATGNLTTCKNTQRGIGIYDGSVTVGGGSGNSIEVDGTLAAGNVIANNGSEGVAIGFGGTPSSVTLTGNIIGLIKSTINDPYNVAAGNTNEGISVSGGTPVITIGGTAGANASANRNVISANGGGIIFKTANNSAATIINNYFNTDWTGVTKLVGAGGGAIDIESGSSTINVGGTGTNQGNLIIPGTSSNLAGAAIETSLTYSGTLNILKNIFGLNAAGTTALSSNDAYILLNAAGATVNIGDGTANGRNVLAGSYVNSIIVQAATAVNVLANYIGFAVDGTTKIPNATNSSHLQTASLPAAEIYLQGGGAVSVVGNLINNFTNIGAYYKNVTPSNESTMTSGNTWYTKAGGLSPTNNFWQRYSGATLAAFGPKACDDGYDNDGDSKADMSDPGCSEAGDTDETDPVTAGGGGVIIAVANSVSNASNSSATNSAAQAKADADAKVAAQAEIQAKADAAAAAQAEVQAKADADAAAKAEVNAKAQINQPVQPQQVSNNVKNYIIAKKLDEGVNVVTNTLLGKDEVNVDLIIKDLVASQAVAERVEIPEVPKTPEQQLVQESLNKLNTGESLTVDEQSQLEATVENTVQSVVSGFYQKAQTGGYVVPEIDVVLSNGKTKKLSGNSKMVFTFDAKKAVDFQELADLKGEDTFVLTSSTVVGNNNVAALVTVMNGGEIGDPLAAEKIFFGGLANLANEKDEIKDLKPDVPMATNLANGSEVAPKFMMWLAGPGAGQQVSIFAIDKIDLKDPTTWKIYKLGKYELEQYKTAVEVDLTGQMDIDLKKFTLVVQDDKGSGTATEVSLNKNVEMKMDTVTIKSGEKIIPSDLTADHSGWAKSIQTSVLMAAVSAKKDLVNGAAGEITLRGYAEPGSVVFVTWKSVVKTSAVIADASQGYFEVRVPKELEKGDHTAYTYSYNKSKKTASSFAKIFFSKYF